MMVKENIVLAPPNGHFWTVTTILEATGGTVVQGNAVSSFSGISIDSRAIEKDELFIAIKGDIYDGHDFINDAVDKGVKGFVLNAHMTKTLNLADYKAGDVVCISVPDTFRALGDLAHHRRKNSNVSVVGITGSNGKTSTRAMTASIASQQFNVLTTKGNFNNEIGLPLTLFKLNNDHDWAVLELAMNRPGEIKRLSEICRPDIGVITNIGPAHLEGLGSIEGVMHAKGELLETLSSKGTAILNADDPLTPQLMKKTNATILQFGLCEAADIKADNIEETDQGVHFTLDMMGNQTSVHLNTPGSFMVSNALASAAVGRCLDLPVETIKTGLEQFVPVPGRMNIMTIDKNIHIIDDTYNANPGSTTAAIHTLITLKKDGRAAIIAGDMHELGDLSHALHRQMGSLSAKSKITKLYITGKFADDVAAGAIEADMDAENIFIGNKDEIIQHLTDWIKPNDWILIKGSRAAGMESVVTGIKKHFNTN